MSLLRISGLIIGLAALLAVRQSVTSFDANTARAALVPNVRLIDVEVETPNENRGRVSGTHETATATKAPALETVQGEIFTTDKVVLRNGLSRGVQIMVETDEEILPAYVGPQWLLDSHELVLKPHDRVTLKGLRTSIDGFDLFVVSEISTGEKTLRIMDQHKLSAWLEMTSRVLEVSNALAQNEN